MGDHDFQPADVTLHPDHSLREALTRMREKNRTFAPVVDGDAIVGVLSVSLLAEAPRDPPNDRNKMAVRDCMMAAVPFLYESDPFSLGTSIAAHTGIDHFCVVDRDHLLLGILSFAGPGRTDRPEPCDCEEVPIDVVRRRVVVTPGRTAREQSEVPVTYADGPTLYVDGRAVHEPRDRPDAVARRRRVAAMKTNP